jgi:hypothetical protein
VARARPVVAFALLAALMIVPASSAAATGDQRVLVVLGTSGDHPFTVADVQAVARQAASFYHTSSFGKLTLHFEVTPWLAAFSADPGCDVESQATFDQAVLPARQAAQHAGFAPANYPHVIYVVADSHCAFTGLTWGQDIALTRAPTLALLLHELGHSFGLAHSRTARCLTDCTVTDPGDPFDPMGTGQDLVDFSAYEKVLMGWLPEPKPLTKSGRYVLVPPTTAGRARRVLMIETRYGPWWIEYRARPFRGLLVRFVDPNQPVSTFAPASILITDPTRRGRDWIAAGPTWHEGKDFTLRLVRAGAREAQVRVQLTAP